MSAIHCWRSTATPFAVRFSRSAFSSSVDFFGDDLASYRNSSISYCYGVSICDRRYRTVMSLSGEVVRTTWYTVWHSVGRLNAVRCREVRRDAARCRDERSSTNTTATSADRCSLQHAPCILTYLTYGLGDDDVVLALRPAAHVVNRCVSMVPYYFNFYCRPYWIFKYGIFLLGLL